jgi:DNA-binding SARP family transcriptional activator
MAQGELARRAAVSIRTVRDIDPIDISAGKLRCLLALLAIQPGQAVTREQAVDVLWRERPPKTCLSLVQGYIGRLRRLVEPEPVPDGADRRLVPTRGGYLLRLTRR